MRSFQEFESEVRAQGFDEVLERRLPPHGLVDGQSLPFTIKAVLVQGEMWLTVAGHTRHLRAGDTFELVENEPHAKRSGIEGATCWVARKSPATRSDPVEPRPKDPPTSSEGQERVPLTPVTPKIGETRGNLQKRAEAFTRRRGKSK